MIFLKSEFEHIIKDSRITALDPLNYKPHAHYCILDVLSSFNGQSN